MYGHRRPTSGAHLTARGREWVVVAPAPFTLGFTADETVAAQLRALFPELDQPTAARYARLPQQRRIRVPGLLEQFRTVGVVEQLLNPPEHNCADTAPLPGRCSAGQFTPAVSRITTSLTRPQVSTCVRLICDGRSVNDAVTASAINGCAVARTLATDGADMSGRELIEVARLLT